MRKTISRWLKTAVLPAVLALTLTLAPSRLRAQYVFEQNDNGQTFQDTDGLGHTFPNNNFWAQPYQTYTDSHGHVFVIAYTNWTALTTFPNGAGVGATVGGACILNESVSFQNLDVTAGGDLEIESSNSGGAGNHAITVTMAAGGAGTIQNDGTLDIAGTDQNMTVTLANTLTLTGGGSFTLRNGTASIQRDRARSSTRPVTRSPSRPARRSARRSPTPGPSTPSRRPSAARRSRTRT